LIIKVKIFENVSDMINDSDLDGNKVLDFEEFLVMMERKAKKTFFKCLNN